VQYHFELTSYDLEGWAESCTALPLVVKIRLSNELQFPALEIIMFWTIYKWSGWCTLVRVYFPQPDTFFPSVLQRFSCIIGPNGSGKSNVIDAMLFVFGYRAQKIRSKKLSVLIHNSEEHTDIQSCSVEVHFQKIIDKVCILLLRRMALILFKRLTT